MRYEFGGMPPIRMNLMLWNLYIAEPLSSAEAPKNSNTSCPPPALSFSFSQLPGTQRDLCGRESCRAARVTYKLPHDLPSIRVRKSSKSDSLFWMYKAKTATLIYKIFNRITPSCLEHLIVGRGDRTSTTWSSPLRACCTFRNLLRHEELHLSQGIHCLELVTSLRG